MGDESVELLFSLNYHRQCMKPKIHVFEDSSDGITVGYNEYEVYITYNYINIITMYIYGYINNGYNGK